MAKSKSGKSRKSKADPKKPDDGSAEIKQAEQRLSKALAEVDAARVKVQRRERDLAKLMERYGRTTPAASETDEAILLQAPNEPASANGGTQQESVPVESEPVEQTVEHTEGVGDDHHYE